MCEVVDEHHDGDHREGVDHDGPQHVTRCEAVEPFEELSHDVSPWGWWMLDII